MWPTYCLPHFKRMLMLLWQSSHKSKFLYVLFLLMHVLKKFYSGHVHKLRICMCVFGLLPLKQAFLDYVH